MATTKVSALASKGTLTGSEEILINDGGTSKKSTVTAVRTGSYTLPEATTTVRGGLELFSDTDQSVAATAVSATASRTYGLQLNSDGQGVVNVPWADTDTNTNQLTTFTVSATTDSNATTISQGDDLMFTAGTGITCETTADGTVTISNTVTDTNTMGSGFTVSATTDTNATTITQGDDLMFTAGSGITQETTADGTVTTTLDLTSDQAWTGSQRATLVVDNDGSFDLNAGQNFKCTPAAGLTLTFTNFANGQSGYIILVNSGGHAIARHADSIADANFVSTVSAAGTYIISYISDGTDAFLTNSAIMA